MLAGLDKEVEEYLLPAQEVCPVCGGELQIIGKEVVRTEVEYIPAKVIVKQIIRQVAKCKRCGTKDGEQKSPSFVKAAVPAPILPHSIATPSLASFSFYQKFAMQLPLICRKHST